MKHPYDILDAEATADAATEAEMQLAWLRGEVAAVIDLVSGSSVYAQCPPWFDRLSVALKATETPLRTDSRHATAEDDSRPPTPTQGA